ncbi:MAG: hypothetical protein WAT43_03530 [Chitinophagales bacterium]
MKTTLFITLFLYAFNAAPLLAQDFNVPANYKFEEAADYDKYDADIIAAAKWLVNTPLNEQDKKRKEVTAFVVKWINGSPTVTVELNEIIIDFDTKNPGMVVIFMASSARYVLENGKVDNMREKHKAALRDLITVYKSGKGITKDKKMEKLIKADEDGKLDEWLDENLKIEH